MLPVDIKFFVWLLDRFEFRRLLLGVDFELSFLEVFGYFFAPSMPMFLPLVVLRLLEPIVAPFLL